MNDRFVENNLKPSRSSEPESNAPAKSVTVEKRAEPVQRKRILRQTSLSFTKTPGKTYQGETISSSLKRQTSANSRPTSSQHVQESVEAAPAPKETTAPVEIAETREPTSDSILETPRSPPLAPVKSKSDSNIQPTVGCLTPRKQKGDVHPLTPGSKRKAVGKDAPVPLQTPTPVAERILDHDDIEEDDGDDENLALHPPTPTKPNVAQFNSPISSEISNLNAKLEQYRHLVRPGFHSLRLPEKFETLIRLFNAVETAVSFFSAQGQVASFCKIKRPVENMSKKSFSLDHLAQIKYAYPDAYIYEAVRQFHGNAIVDTISLKINFTEESKFAGDVSGDLKATLGQISPQKNIKMTLATFMEKRKLKFRDILVDFVKSRHEAFVAGLPNAKSIVLTKAPLKQWHPDFSLDSVPDIPKAELPSNKPVPEVKVVEQPAKAEVRRRDFVMSFFVLQ